MSDIFIRNLFSAVFKKIGMDVDPQSGKEEHELIIDNEHPVLMRYDKILEQVMLIGMINIDSIPKTERPKLMERLLRAGLNPLRGIDPGAGIDDKSGLCFSYFTLPRNSVNVDVICEKMVRLVEWNKKILITYAQSV